MAYIVKICCFENRCSSINVMKISVAFRRIDRSGVRKKFRVNCCVRVSRPSSRRLGGSVTPSMVA